MRILLVSEDLPGEQVGGLGKHVVRLGNGLLARGHAVSILGRSDCAGSAAHIGFRGHLQPGFDLAHPGWKEKQMGVFNPFKRPFFARKIAAAINRHAGDADVVHYHGHLPLVALFVDPAVNFVQTRHDQGSECLTHLRFRGGEVCATRDARDCSACIRADAGALRKSVTALAVDGYRQASARAFATRKTVFVSDFLRRQFLRAAPGADLSRCRVIPNFVDYPRLLEVAESASAAARAAGAVDCAGTPCADIVLVGRVDTGKGFGEFLAAWEAAGAPAQAARIVVVGDGPQRAALEARHGGAGVCFLGWQDDQAALAMAARSRLCVVPSVCEEACSTTVLEALALGKSCIALARGGTPELARYQQYPGQLLLAETMPALVERVRARLAAPPIPSIPAASFGADAAVILPRLVDLYAE